MVSRSRWLQAGLFLFTVLVMAVAPIRNYLLHPNKMGWPLYSAEFPPKYELPHHGNKDYPLWYYTGRLVIEDKNLTGADGGPRLLYPSEKNVAFPFMYPPFAAIVLAPLSLLGPVGMLLALIVLNAVAFAVVVELSVQMVAGTGNVSIWLRLIPTGFSLFFVNDMFLLGQPNLGLLALVLGGLMLDRSGRGGWAGVLFALAAAIKAFPVVVLVYLVWRRRWKAVISMILCCIAFFYLLPGLLRGFDRTNTELKTWANGMLFNNNEEGIGQRPGLSVSYKNQSIFGLAYRLIGRGPINAEDVLIRDAEEPMRVQLETIANTDPDPGKRAAAAERLADFEARWARGYPEPILISPFKLDQKPTQYIAYACCAVLGLLFVAVMPKSARRTRRTDAAEFGMLIILMTIGTPYAYGYYMVWMIYPLHVVLHEALENRQARTRSIAWDVIIAVVILYVVSAPVADNIYPMAYGSFFWASMVLLGGLIWIRFLQDADPTSSPPALATEVLPTHQPVSSPAVASVSP
jgi:Glycosyltransferase family 87